MKYNCEICDYATDVHRNFLKHIKSKKHEEKVTEKRNKSISNSHTILIESKERIEMSQAKRLSYNCQFCDNSYLNASNLTKHMKSCLKKKQLVDEFVCKENNMKREIEDLRKTIMAQNDIIKCKDEIIAKEIVHKDDIVKNKDETILILTHENKNLKTILSSAGTLVEKSMSTFNFINTHYNEAPALKAITDVPSLHSNLAENKIVQAIISEFRSHTLVSFLGKLIVKNHKKEDPKLQAIWNSDADRLTYIIRTILKNNSMQWEVDKKGVNTIAYIIQPILDYIKKQMKNYIQTCDIGTRADKTDKVMAITNRMEDAFKIMTIVKNGTLAEDILKFIAPRLYVVRDIQLIN